VWAPEPEQIVETLTEWIHNPEIRLAYAENCRRAARPDAARQIARAIGETLELVSESAVLEK
jgi:UDP-N-acetylglucosamine:LPS N-acetylglucosamine transferase